jgi:hypothetical protein
MNRLQIDLDMKNQEQENTVFKLNVARAESHQLK